jgi:hypothetical protein
MDARRCLGDSWRLVFDTTVDHHAPACHGDLSKARGPRGGRQSRRLVLVVVCIAPIVLEISLKTEKTSLAHATLSFTSATLRLSGIQVLFDVQRSKTGGLHIKEASENLAEIV